MRLSLLCLAPTDLVLGAAQGAHASMLPCPDSCDIKSKVARSRVGLAGTGVPAIAKAYVKLKSKEEFENNAATIHFHMRAAE